MTEELKTKEINLMNDCLFKTLMKSKEAREMVASFLSSITGIDKKTLIDATYISGELSKLKEYEKKKLTDVLVLIDDYNRIVIEMNQYWNDQLFSKNSGYVFSNILDLTREGKHKYPKVVMISLDNFNKFKTNSPILTFKIRDEENHIENEMYTSVHLILDNLVNSKYNKNIQEEIKKFSKFLKTNTLEELRETFKGDDNYMSSIDKIEDLIREPNFGVVYDAEERRKQDMLAFKMTGLREGREEGLKQGLEEGKKKGIKEGIKEGIKKGERTKQFEIAKEMLNKNIDLETISECTKLSIQQIKELI